MTTKDYLNQINRLDKMIQNKLSEIYRLKAMACSVTVSTEKEAVQMSASKDKLGNAVTKIIDLENETNILVSDFVEKRKHIINQIDGMDNVEYYQVLSMRYVNQNTFEEIAENTNWSIRKIFLLHGRALQEFERLYGNEYLQNVQ